MMYWINNFVDKKDLTNDENLVGTIFAQAYWFRHIIKGELDSHFKMINYIYWKIACTENIV